MFIENIASKAIKPAAKFALSALERAAAKTAERKGLLGSIGTAVGSLIPREVQAQPPQQTGSPSTFWKIAGLFDPTNFFGSPIQEGQEPKVDYTQKSPSGGVSIGGATPPPSQPMTPGGFVARTPALPGKPGVISPLAAKPAPIPAVKPPTPAFSGGVGVKPPAQAPEPSLLPPAPILPSSIGGGQASSPAYGLLREIIQQSGDPAYQINYPGGSITGQHRGRVEEEYQNQIKRLTASQAPQEASLPPTSLPPASRETAIAQPLGQFESMIRALLNIQGEPSKFVQMPMAGAASFGPAGAQERALRKLRERELSRILGGVPVNV